MGSGFKDFVAGAVLAANDVDGYLMRQTLMTFADSSARDTALSGVLDEGMIAYLEDTNAVTYYTGAAWRTIYLPETSWTPTFTNLTVGNGTLAGRYTRAGDLVRATFMLTWGTTTSISGAVSISNLPITGSTATDAVGAAMWRDVSAGTSYLGVLAQATGTTCGLHTHNAGAVNTTVPFTWANTDIMRGELVYTAA